MAADVLGAWKRHRRTQFTFDEDGNLLMSQMFNGADRTKSEKK
jgi:hypothetical protein